MDPVNDLQEPDEARPAKRVRLDAPLGITEEIQEEGFDDEDWDDVYDNGATPNGKRSPDGGVPLAPALENPPVQDLRSEEEVAEAVPADAVDHGEELLMEEQSAVGADDPAARMLEETAEVEVGEAHKHEVQGEADADERVEELSSKDEGEVSIVKQAENIDIAPPEEGVSNDANFANTDDVQAKPGPEEDPGFLAVAAAQKDNEKAEWQFDASDAQSSSGDESTSDSEDSSGQSESGSEGGYEMLDPATAAKILMSGDGDDDGDNSKSKTGDHQPRTANEVREVVVPKPDVIVTEDTKVTDLGTVDRAVENMVLIKAVTPGEFQVLEAGSVLCNEKREVIGAVAETLGRVQEPMYSVAFTNSKEVEDLGLEHGAKVFYVDDHSRFVFTQPLKNMKGTDASNIHDEEVGEDELEFSDDEAEAEYKRQKKLAKRGGRGGLSRTAFNENRTARSFGAPGYDSGPTYIRGSDAPQQSYGSGMSYDEGDVQEEFYSPLKRPDNLSELMASGGPPMRPPNGTFDRGRGRGRGRGDRGRGRGDRGRGRGDHRNQRGGRGGYAQSEQNRGGYGQQNGHRGNAHSFPDRHNSDLANGQRQHSPPDRRNAQRSSPQLPSQQQSYQQYQQQYPQQAPNQQSYQFNGYTFQYGHPPPQQSTQQTGYYNAQQPAVQSPSAAFPAGAYVNPAFFQNQGQSAQPQNQQQPQYSWQGQQQAQQYQYAQPGGQTPQTQQQSNLADILRQFGRQQQR